MANRKGPRRPLGDYQVGYGRPPVSGQFSKGRSGNPGGRPSKHKAKSASPAGESKAAGRDALQQVIHDELKRPISVQENGDTTTLTAQQAAVRSIIVAAMKGRPQAQRLVLELAAEAEENDKSLRKHWKRVVDVYRTEHARLVNKFKRENPDTFCWLPHPDDVFFNEEEGTADFRGPFTEFGWLSMIQVRRLRDEAMFAMREILEIQCSNAMLRCYLRQKANRIYNAARLFNSELPDRFHEDMDFLTPSGWEPSDDSQADMFYREQLNQYHQNWLSSSMRNRPPELPSRTHFLSSTERVNLSS